MLFSHLKISSFRAKAHLVFHWCLYDKKIYVVFVIDYFIRDQFTFLAKINIRVKSFSVYNLYLTENSMFVKHVT